MGKSMAPQPTAGVYRDEPDRDDAASTSSAVPMEYIDYPETGLPAYEDVVSSERIGRNAAPECEPQA